MCLGIAHVSGKVPLSGQGVWQIHNVSARFAPGICKAKRVDTLCICQTPCPERGTLPDTWEIPKHIGVNTGLGAPNISWWTFRYLVFFFCSGRGKGESEAPGGGGRFFIQNPRRGGFSKWGRGREVVWSELGIWGGGC